MFIDYFIKFVVKRQKSLLTFVSLSGTEWSQLISKRSFIKFLSVKLEKSRESNLAGFSFDIGDCEIQNWAKWSLTSEIRFPLMIFSSTLLVKILSIKVAEFFCNIRLQAPMHTSWKVWDFTLVFLWCEQMGWHGRMYRHAIAKISRRLRSRSLRAPKDIPYYAGLVWL